jgi:hypothetical protein
VTEILGLLFGAALVLAGARQAARPAAYVGKGIPPATDPRTVRHFGAAMMVGGGFISLLNLILLAQG